MIGGGGTGGSFSGLASYLTEDENRVNYTRTRNCFERSERPDRVAQEMKDAAAASERVEKPVYHLHISWPEEDQSTQVERREAMEEVLEDLGLGDRQALIVEHDDAKPHVHAMVNRVQHDPYAEDYGTAWDTGHDWQKIEASLRRIEQERGWRQVPGKMAETPGQAEEPGEAWTSGQMQYFKRTKDLPLADQVKAETEPYFETADSWDDLDRALRDKNLKVERKGRGGVVRHEPSGEAVKLSSVGREYSLGKLEDRFDEQYSEFLERRKAEREEADRKREQRGQQREGPARSAERADRSGEAEGPGRRGASAGASRGSGRNEDAEQPVRGASQDVEGGSVKREGSTGGAEFAGSPSRGDAGSEREGAGADRGGSGEPSGSSARDDDFGSSDELDNSPGLSGGEPLDTQWATPFNPDEGESDESEGDRDDGSGPGASESEAESFEEGFDSSGEFDSGEQVDEDLSFEEQLNEILPPEKYGRGPASGSEGASSGEGVPEASEFEAPQSGKKEALEALRAIKHADQKERIPSFEERYRALKKAETLQERHLSGLSDRERAEIDIEAQMGIDTLEKANYIPGPDAGRVIDRLNESAAAEGQEATEEALSAARSALEDVPGSDREWLRGQISDRWADAVGLSEESQSKGQDRSRGKDDSEGKGQDRDRGRSRGRGMGF